MLFLATNSGPQNRHHSKMWTWEAHRQETGNKIHIHVGRKQMNLMREYPGGEPSNGLKKKKIELSLWQFLPNLLSQSGDTAPCLPWLPIDRVVGNARMCDMTFFPSFVPELKKWRTQECLLGRFHCSKKWMVISSAVLCLDEYHPHRQVTRTTCVVTLFSNSHLHQSEGKRETLILICCI